MNRKLKLSVLLYRWILVLGVLVFPFKMVWAEESYCWVLNQSDNVETESSLRWTIEEVFNVYSNPYCAPPDQSPGDSDYFDQVILFEEDAVKEIILGSSSRRNDAINFDNSSDTLAIGNWSEENVTDPDSEINYSDNYSSLESPDFSLTQ